REGGKTLQADLEQMGLKVEEAAPTPVGVARAAAARGAELRAAVAAAPTPEARATAQAAMNEFYSAVNRRLGPTMEQIARVESEASLDSRVATAEKTADAFRSKIEPHQLQDQARAAQAAGAEQAGIFKRAWTSFGEYAGEGVTNLTKEFSESSRSAL